MKPGPEPKPEVDEAELDALVGTYLGNSRSEVITFILKVNSDIERVADHAVSIAKVAIKLAPQFQYAFGARRAVGADHDRARPLQAVAILEILQ